MAGKGEREVGMGSGKKKKSTNKMSKRTKISVILRAGRPRADLEGKNVLIRRPRVM